MLLTTKEMAQELKVCTTTVKRMVSDGRIQQKYWTKIGNQYRFNGKAVVEHLLNKKHSLPINP